MTPVQKMMSRTVPHRSFTALGRRLRGAEGFTIIESLVAAVVLVVGMLGAFAFLDTSVMTSRNTAAREGATTLARQITEDAREIPFSQLSNSTLVTTLQGYPGLANQGSGATWQIQRRGITYTINASECAVDDATNGYGVHSSSITWCSDSTQTGTQDTQPDNFDRVTVDVTWNALGSNHDVHEVATIGSTGQAVGLNTSNLQFTPWPTVGVGGTPSQPQVTSSTVTQMNFSVSAPSGTTAIIWTVNGVAQSWTSTQVGSSWTSSPWTIGGLSDGVYQIGAAAENGSGVIGQAITIPVQLIRGAPAAPNVTGYGYNTNLYEGGSGPFTVAELQWRADPQLNVTGYHIYNPSGTLICSTTTTTANSSCGASAWCTTEISCIDLSPPPANQTSPPLTYVVKAVYNNSLGISTEGPATNVTMNGTPFKTFTFAPSTGNTGSKCSGGSSPTLQDMLATYTPGSTASQLLTSSSTITFCSDAFSAGQQIEGGGTASVYLKNPNSTACTINSTLGVDGIQAVPNSPTVSVPANTTTPTKYTFTYTLNSVLNMNAGDRLTLNYGPPSSGSGCGTTSSKEPSIYYGSSADPSQLQTTPLPVQAPGAVSSLTGTTNADGSETLTWNAPSGGTPVNFYRVYRGGKNYTNRYDTVDPNVSCTSGSCSWTDPPNKRSSAPYSYYVTAVGGTTAGANMAESAVTGPVSG